MDDGFGIMEGTKKDVEYWIKIEYMDLYIERTINFIPLGFWILEFSKKKSIGSYIPSESGHVSLTNKTKCKVKLKDTFGYLLF